MCFQTRVLRHTERGLLSCTFESDEAWVFSSLYILLNCIMHFLIPLTYPFSCGEDDAELNVNYFFSVCILLHRCN